MDGIRPHTSVNLTLNKIYCLGLDIIIGYSPTSMI
jgi:hypothetical protein